MCSEHKDREGKDNKAFVIFNLCNANVGWLGLVVPALIISFLACVSLLNTSNFWSSQFWRDCVIRLLVGGHQLLFGEDFQGCYLHKSTIFLAQKE